MLQLPILPESRGSPAWMRLWSEGVTFLGLHPGLGFCSTRNQFAWVEKGGCACLTWGRVMLTLAQAETLLVDRQLCSFLKRTALGQMKCNALPRVEKRTAAHCRAMQGGDWPRKVQQGTRGGRGGDRNRGGDRQQWYCTWRPFLPVQFQFWQHCLCTLLDASITDISIQVQHKKEGDRLKYFLKV